MPEAKRTQPKESSQLDKFKQAARDAGADQDEEAFKRRLAKVAKAPAPKSKPKSDTSSE